MAADNILRTFIVCKAVITSINVEVSKLYFHTLIRTTDILSYLKCASIVIEFLDRISSLAEFTVV